MGKQQDTPAPPANVQRISVDRLSPDERQELEEQGRDLTGEFVDIELDQRRPPTDPTAPERAKAVEELESVIKQPAPAQQPSNQALAEISELQAENRRLQQELEKKPEHCPRCAWPTAMPVEHLPTDEDITNFLESVVSGEVFVKSYELYGGAVQVEFRTRLSCEMEAIKEHVMDVSGGVLTEEMLGLTDELVFLTSLKSVRLKDKNLSFASLADLLDQRKAAEDGGQQVKSVGVMLRERADRIPSQLRIPLRQMYVEFSAIVEHLMTKATDPKYWKGATA